MIVPRYGMGDDATVTNPLDLSLSEIGGMVPGFLMQQWNGFPTWTWFGGAFLLTWWLFFPHGSDYRREKRELKAKHTGASKIRKRAKKIRGGFA